MTHQHELVFLTPSLIGGGIEASAPILIQSFKDVERLKTIWIGVNSSSIPNSLPNTLTFSGERKSKDGLFKTLKSLYKLRSFILSLKSPIVIANGEMAELIASTLPSQVKTICVEHTSKPWSMSPRLGYWVRKVLMSKVDEWVTVNLSQKEIWPGIKEFSMIPNPVLLVTPNESERVIGLFTLARLVEGKGVETVCQVASQLGTPLNVYGNGAIEAKLKSKYVGYKNIRFWGYQPKVWQSIGPNQVLISASKYEGDGRTIAEAIIRRQPILLLDTIDHRRFGLPQSNYFTDSENLILKLRDMSIESIDRLRPPPHISEAELILRNPATVAELWFKVIHRVVTVK